MKLEATSSISVPVHSAGRIPPTLPHRTWQVTQLPTLSGTELRAVIDVMPAWLFKRAWTLPDGTDSSRVWEYIDRHGLGGALGALAVEGYVREQNIAELARDRYLSNSLHFERAKLVCRQMSLAANKSGARLLNFKGPVLASQAYDDSGVRAFSDIDLWTDSRTGLLSLIAESGAQVIEDCDQAGLVRRIRGPGCITAALGGWEIEARYPTPNATDPMLQVLSELDTSNWPAASGSITAPDPSRHLLILLFHTAWYHYFSRFIWFLDIAALVLRQKDQIDLDWIGYQVRRLGTTNVLGAASAFCRTYIDPQFPSFPLDQHAWNVRFVRITCDPIMIASGRFSLQQSGPINAFRILSLRSLRHYLLADPHEGSLLKAPSFRWLRATLARGAPSIGKQTRFVLSAIMAALLYPFARVVGRTTASLDTREADIALQ